MSAHTRASSSTISWSAPPTVGTSRSRLHDRFPQVHVAQLAVADAPGRATFYHAIEQPAWSGLQIQDYPSGTSLEEIDVTVARLDDVVADPAEVDFVKIDVEGAELRVLQGMSQIMSSGRATVLFEHAIIHAKAHETTPAQIFDAIAVRGYEVWGLDGNGPHDRQAFVALCEYSDRSGYGRRAQTNWVARRDKPSSTSSRACPALAGGARDGAGYSGK
jgi:FkbM family methyltransferase